MTKDEALKLALDFVASISPAFICEATHHKKNERHTANEPCPHVAKQKATYEAIKEALMSDTDGAQPEQELVAWEQFYPEMGKPKLAYLSPTESPDNACYIQPQRTWVGLTDEEILDNCESVPDYDIGNHDLIKFARAIEAKLRSKND